MPPAPVSCRASSPRLPASVAECPESRPMCRRVCTSHSTVARRNPIASSDAPFSMNSRASGVVRCADHASAKSDRIKEHPAPIPFDARRSCVPCRRYHSFYHPCDSGRRACAVGTRLAFLSHGTFVCRGRYLGHTFLDLPPHRPSDGALGVASPRHFWSIKDPSMAVYRCNNWNCSSKCLICGEPIHRTIVMVESWDIWSQWVMGWVAATRYLACAVVG
jgi:hypothetical protein